MYNINEAKILISIDSIDFVNNQGKQVHVQNANELKEYIESNVLYFDFFNEKVYRYFEEVDNYLECGTINAGDRIILKFKLYDVSHELKQAIESEKQEIFYDFFNGDAWAFNESTGENELIGFFNFHLIDVSDINISELNIRHDAEITVTIDSIDFVDNQEKQAHVQNANELKECIESNDLYFDFFNQIIYRYDEEADGHIECGNINAGNQIILTFKLTNVSPPLWQALESNQEVFFDLLNREAWIFKDGNEELLDGFSDAQLIDVEINKNEVTTIINSVRFGYFDEVDNYLQSGKIKVGDKVQIKFKLENISDELKKAIELHRHVFYDFFNNEVWTLEGDNLEEKMLGNLEYQIIDISTLNN